MSDLLGAGNIFCPLGGRVFDTVHSYDSTHAFRRVRGRESKEDVLTRFSIRVDMTDKTILIDCQAVADRKFHFLTDGDGPGVPLLNGVVYCTFIDQSRIRKYIERHIA